MRASPVRRSALSKGGLVAFLALAAVGLSLSLGLSSSAPSASADVGCFGGPPIGAACGTLTRGEPPQPRERPHAGAEGRARARPGRDDGSADRLRQHRPAERVPRDQSRRDRLGARCGLRRPGRRQQRRQEPRHPAAAADRRSRRRSPEPPGDGPAGAGRADGDVRSRRGQRLRRRDRPRGAGDEPGRPLRADDQPGRVPDRRSQLRDARRGSVPRGRAGGARDRSACRARG